MEGLIGLIIGIVLLILLFVSLGVSISGVIKKNLSKWRYFLVKTPWNYWFDVRPWLKFLIIKIVQSITFIVLFCVFLSLGLLKSMLKSIESKGKKIV